MIRPNAHWPDPTKTCRLAVLVETTVHRMLGDHPAAIVLELDIDPMLPIPADPGMVHLVVESLIRSSLADMPDGGELDIAAVETEHGVELEIADTGPPAESRPRRVPLVVAQLRATIDWRDCPTGGTAVTVTFPPAAGEQSEPAPVRRVA